MPFKFGPEYRHHRYAMTNRLGNDKYDYVHEGILYRILPKILFKGNSRIVAFLQLIDVRLIMMFQAIDKIKKFKHITSY